jgi:hypothetical protein
VTDLTGERPSIDSADHDRHITRGDDPEAIAFALELGLWR